MPARAHNTFSNSKKNIFNFYKQKLDYNTLEPFQNDNYYIIKRKISDCVRYVLSSHVRISTLIICFRFKNWNVPFSRCGIRNLDKTERVFLRASCDYIHSDSVLSLNAGIRAILLWLPV